MALAHDIVLPLAKVLLDTDGDLPYRGILDATYRVTNLVSSTEFPFNNYDGSTANLGSSKRTLELYGGVSPQGVATYASCPLGSTFHVFTMALNVVTAYAKFIKTATGASGWSKINTSITTESSVIIASGTAVLTATTIQTITVSGITVTDLVNVQISTQGSLTATIQNSNTRSAGFIVVNLSAAGATDAYLKYWVTRAITA